MGSSGDGGQAKVPLDIYDKDALTLVSHFSFRFKFFYYAVWLCFVVCLPFAFDARPQSLKSFSLHAQVCF